MQKMIERHYTHFLIIIVIFAFVTRIYRLSTPSTYMFDEVYHAVTAKLILHNDPRAFEWWNPPPEPNTAVDWLHPPLAKYTQAIGMGIFGENSFGWRISAVIFGTMLVVVTAKLADALFENKSLALLAAFFAACDGLLLTQSRIAMNDIHVTFFIVLTFVVYIKFRKAVKTNYLLMFLTGLSAGLACGSKWSGVFAIVVIGFFEFLDLVNKKYAINLGYFLSRIAFLLVLPGVMYIFAYSQMFMQGKTLICEGNQVQQNACYCSNESSLWVQALEKIVPERTEYWKSLEARGGCTRLISHFSELHTQIWWYQTNLKATHTFQSRPWQWFLDARPVWFYVDYQDTTIANIYAQGNPLLFWFGDVAVIVSIITLFLNLKKLKKSAKKLWPLFFILIAYFTVWLPWEASPRIMFFYHYTPAVPLLSIILAYWLIQLCRLKNGKILAGICTVLIFCTFVLFYPNWTGMPVAKSFADAVYFAIPSWK